MASAGEARGPYVVPRYREAGDLAWYHVLHGTVPGHQIDFIYCPEVPQGALTRTHFAHVARLIKYIEPREKASFAFALGNLSRDDVQHDPGHGGIALIFGLRVEGVVDHASRSMPPYAHGILAVDRALDYSALIHAITTFYRRFLHEGPEDATGSFYRAYVRAMREDRGSVENFLRMYVNDFDELPQPERSKLGWDYVADDEARLERITIIHPNGEPFSTVASVAATLGSLLYRSNIKWTTISNSREFDIPGGISVRFLPESERPRDPKGRVFRLDEIPDDEAEIAHKLFSAKPRSTGGSRRANWRAQYEAARGTGSAPAEGAHARLPSTRPPEGAPPSPALNARGKRGLPPSPPITAAPPPQAESPPPPAEEPIAVPAVTTAAADPVRPALPSAGPVPAEPEKREADTPAPAVMPTPQAMPDLAAGNDKPASASAGPVSEPAGVDVAIIEEEGLTVDDAAVTLAAPMQAAEAPAPAKKPGAAKDEPQVDDAAATLVAPMHASPVGPPQAPERPPIAAAVAERPPIAAAVAEKPPVAAAPPERPKVAAVEPAKRAAAPAPQPDGPLDTAESEGQPTPKRARWLVLGGVAVAAIAGVIIVSSSPETGHDTTAPPASGTGTSIPTQTQAPLPRTAPSGSPAPGSAAPAGTPSTNAAGGATSGTAEPAGTGPASPGGKKRKPPLAPPAGTTAAPATPTAPTAPATDPPPPSKPPTPKPPPTTILDKPL